MPTTKSDTDPLTTALPEDAYQTEQTKSGPIRVACRRADREGRPRSDGIGESDPIRPATRPTPKDAKENVPNEGIQPTKKGK